MRNFSLNNQCAVVEELACFQYSLNDKNSNYREKQSLILRLPPAYCWYPFQYRVERDNVEQSFLETTYSIEVTNLASKQQPSNRPIASPAL